MRCVFYVNKKKKICLSKKVGKGKKKISSTAKNLSTAIC
jgi:hypothetical protein